MLPYYLGFRYLKASYNSFHSYASKGFQSSSCKYLPLRTQNDYHLKGLSVFRDLRFSNPQDIVSCDLAIHFKLIYQKNLLYFKSSVVFNNAQGDYLHDEAHVGIDVIQTIDCTCSFIDNDAIIFAG